MVSPAPDCTHAEDMLSEVEPFVEQYFPRQLSWYAPDRPGGPTEEIARWIRQHPWTAITLAAAAGLVASQLVGPALHLTRAAMPPGCPKTTSTSTG